MTGAGDDYQRRKRIAELTELACQRLDRHDGERVWRAAQQLTNLAVGVDYRGSANTATEHRTLAQIYDAAALLQFALTARTPQTRVAALPLLAVLAPREASDIIMAFIDANLGSANATSYEGGVLRGVSIAFQHAAGELPAQWKQRRVLDGLLHVGFLSVADLCAIPLDDVLDALIADRLEGFTAKVAELLCDQHPGLSDGDGMLAGFERVTSHHFRARGELENQMLEGFAEAGYAEAGPAIARLLDHYEGRAVVFVAQTLIRLGYGPGLQRLADQLESEQARMVRSWDPHHVDLDWEWPLRASFALDPHTACQRLGPYLSAEATSTAHGAKLASDILMLATTVSVHDYGGSGHPGNPLWLAQDPGWVSLLDQLRDHSLLGSAATAARRLLPQTETSAVLRRTGGKKTIPRQP